MMHYFSPKTANMFQLQQDLNIKNVKECRDGMPKSCKQGRDDIIVKVNLQSLIPALFSH